MYSNQRGSTLDVPPNLHPAVCRHSSLRVVRFGADLRIEHYALLRRHPPREKQAAEENTVLDQLGVLHDLHHRDVSQVDSVGVLQILH